MSISNPFLTLVYWISCFVSMATTVNSGHKICHHQNSVTTYMYKCSNLFNAECTTVTITSEMDICQEVISTYLHHDNITKCCHSIENVHCYDKKVLAIDCLMYFLKNDSTEAQCFLTKCINGNFDQDTICAMITEYYTIPNITQLICGSVTSSSVNDTLLVHASTTAASFAETSSLRHLSTTSASFAKTTHTTASTHSNSQSLSPSSHQNKDSFSTTVIWGVVLGVVILLTATILMLAAVCVITAVKRNKPQGADEARMEELNDYAELPEQPQQQQTSTDQINNNEGYSTVTDWLAQDYTTPIDNTVNSHQAHIYNTLMDPEATSHSYANLMRSRNPKSESTSTRENCLQVYSTATGQDDKKATSHQSHHYTSLVNPDTSSHGYAEPTRSEEPIGESINESKQCPQVYSTAIRQDDKKATSHQSHHYTSLMNPDTSSHGYAEPTRSEELIGESTNESKQCLQVYSTVIRQDGKKVTVNFTASDLSEQHQNENLVLAEGKNDLVNEITSSPPTSNVSAPTGRDVQASTMYSTVMRQDGEKITIRVQAPTEEHDS